MYPNKTAANVKQARASFTSNRFLYGNRRKKSLIEKMQEARENN